MKRRHFLHFIRNENGFIWRRMAILAIGIGLLFVIMVTATVATAVHLENQDTFCASCHTQPETVYVERSQGEHPSDLASAHAQFETAVRCIDCHSGYGNSGRAMALYQGAIDTINYVVGAYDSPATVDRPLGDDPCLKCHTQPSRDNPTTIEDDPSLIGSIAHYHWIEYTSAWMKADFDPHGTCSSCHPSHSDATRAVLGYRDMQGVNLTCDGCHLALQGTIP